ncbi:Zn-ribbon domain-containing OB-fold protein [Streptomyces abyssomicinicus]|uniref:Zn-ribbon domain-containing OB-fold protein n=1 Tax=Streptomyces abyssomicinicus TaxID=574929 RepID=UPI001250CD6E|nr:OB-fold domain-containing protein [Streptomyces abyssomicinicus]
MSLQETAEAPVDSFGQFFREGGEGTVALPHCQDCDRHHWYPMERCPHCFSQRLAWGSVSGRATVYSVTTVRYAFTAANRGRTPYGIALVTFDDVPDVRMVCRTGACEEGSDVAVGDAVMVSVTADATDQDTGMVTCAPLPRNAGSGAHGER